ncbi:putative transmembrane protein 217B [Saccopteryx bilineata]|uniref:putative transmembrane protein 217B n=1 Tax=Saccopteryx bilineata TaxID=59482 RepID=UPI00339032DE
MNDKTVCLQLGIFSVLNTIQFLILDLNNAVSLGYEHKLDIYTNEKAGNALWLLTNRKSISISLSIIAVLVSLQFLYCIQVKNYRGLLGYTVWLVIQDCINFYRVLVVKTIIKEMFEELAYLPLTFEVARMFLHIFCLPFLAKHTYTLYKGAQALHETTSHRFSSLSMSDFWPPARPGVPYRKLN